MNNVMDLLVHLEQTRVLTWVRQSGSLLAFPTLLLLHTYGMAVLVGIAAAIDIRILGFAPALPVAPLKRFLPVLWAAFWVNAVTGTILLAADATTKLPSPDFWIKMGFITLAVVIQRLIQQRIFRDPGGAGEPYSAGLRMLAVASLTCWLGAITAGSLLAYLGEVSGLQ